MGALGARPLAHQPPGDDQMLREALGFVVLQREVARPFINERAHREFDDNRHQQNGEEPTNQTERAGNLEVQARFTDALNM